MRTVLTIESVSSFLRFPSHTSFILVLTMKFIFGLLSFVTFGFIIGSFYQLTILRQLGDSHGTGRMSPRARRLHQRDGFLQLPRGNPLWKNDKEVEILRLGYIKPEVLSWSPRIILLHNFLSIEESEYLKAIALPHLQSSQVVDGETGESHTSKIRTSNGMFLSRKDREHPMVQAIEKRISIYAQVPIENGEHVQILRYEKDQYYIPHGDYFVDKYNLKHGGQRVATMLMYLSDNVEGGETYFPEAGSGECNCGGRTYKGLSVKPIKGNAVLFWSMGLDGESDPKTLHGACKVLSGQKWAAVKWMRQRAFV